MKTFKSIFTILLCLFILLLSPAVNSSDNKVQKIQPEMISHVNPKYPQNLKDAGISGNVLVKVRLDKKGTVRRATLWKSSGHNEFDEASLKAAYYNKFTPGIIDGKPVYVWVSYRVSFNADGVEINQTKKKAVSEPKIIKKAEPIYPKEAREYSIETVVWVNALIDKEGKPVKVKIKDCLIKDMGFEKAAIEATYKSEFAPGFNRGKKTKDWLTFLVVFDLVDQDDADRLPRPDDYVPLDIIPEIILQVQPEYPEEAKRRGVAGEVTIKALINIDGNVLKAIVSKSSGVESFDEAAREVAYKNIFRPGVFDDKPIACWFAFKVSFTLDY